MRFFFFISFYFLSFVALSQDSLSYANVNYRIYEIESVLIEKNQDYNKANQEFRNLFEQCDYRFLYGYQIALNNLFCNLNATWNTDSSDIDIYIRKASLSYSDKSVSYWCLSCADKKTKNIIVKKVKSYSALRRKSENSELIGEIVSMCKQDQRVRKGGNSQRIWNMIRKTDSANRIRLDTMFTQLGFIPGIREIGIKGWIDLSTILHHVPYEWICKWSNYLFNGIHSGNFDPQMVANIIDYTKRSSEGKIIDSKFHIPYSIYGGTAMSGIGFPVKDINKADIKRKDIGLPPLEYSLKKIGYKYDEEEFTNLTGLGLID